MHRIFFCFCFFVLSIPAWAYYNTGNVTGSVNLTTWRGDNRAWGRLGGTLGVIRPLGGGRSPFSWEGHFFGSWYAHVPLSRFAGSLGVKWVQPLGDNLMLTHVFFDGGRTAGVSFVGQGSMGWAYWLRNRLFGLNIYVPFSHTALHERAVYEGKVIERGENKVRHSAARFYPLSPTALWGGDIWLGSLFPRVPGLGAFVRMFLYRSIYWGGELKVRYLYPIVRDFGRSALFLGVEPRLGYDSSNFTTLTLAIFLRWDRSPDDLRVNFTPRRFAPTVKRTNQYTYRADVVAPPEKKKK